MRAFLNDTIEDLRERRLLPVALLLALATLAAPVALMKHGGAQAAPAPPPAPAQELKPLSALAKLDKVPKPSLHSLGAKDPFGGAHVPKLTSLANAAGAKTSAAVPSASTGGGGGGGGGGAITVPPVGAGTPSAPLQAFKRPKSKTVVYTFVVDVAFGDPQNPTPRRGLKRFAMLPDTTTPLLVFLGVDSSASRALFLVDASLTRSGEGHCGDHACSFIELGAGNQETFTDQQGRQYLLRVDQIRKVRVRRRAHASRSHASASAAVGRQQAQGTGGVAPRHFLSPLFGDRVETSVQR